MKTTVANSKRGITLVEFLIVLSVIAVLIAMLLPAIVHPRHPYRINCVNNLRQLELAFKTWAVDNNDQFPMLVSGTNGGTMESADRGVAFTSFEVMSNEISAPKLLICPEDKGRKPTPNFQELRNENVSYFVGVDVTETNQTAFLVGDRNLSLNDMPVKPGLFSFMTNSAVGWTKELHVNHGNIGMVDGSVQIMAIDYLRAMVPSTGFATNRLAVP